MTTNTNQGPLSDYSPLIRTIAWLPVAFLVVWLVLVFNDATYDLVTQGFRQSREYTVIEMVTAFAFLFAAGVSLLCVIRMAKSGGKTLQALAFLVFSVAAFLVAMEEVQWGQPILGYEIPGWMADKNVQREFTFHNMEQAHGKAELFYLVFVVLALLLYLRRMPLLPESVWQDVRATKALLPTVGCIFVTAVLKAATTLGSFDVQTVDAIRWTTEVTEMFIALWALGYIAERYYTFRQG